MDVLRPPVVWIGNRCYRKAESREMTRATSEDDGGNTYPVDVEEPLDDSGECIPECRPTKDGQYELMMEIPSTLCGHVIGAKGATRKRLENETGARITLPHINVDGITWIRGKNRQQVERAYSRVKALVDVARHRHPFTHFVSLPLNSESIRKRFSEFQENVLEKCEKERGMRNMLFQHPSKLHLTVGTLVLLTASERNKAAELLNSCTDSIVKAALGDSKLVVQVGSLEIMNDDASDVDVLYAKVAPLDDSNRLQLLADMLVERFVSAGMMERQREKVKLHATLMNSRFDSSRAEGDDGNCDKRESFDARRIFQLFADFDFGEFHINSVHLSQRYTTAKDGYYTASAIATLP